MGLRRIAFALGEPVLLTLEGRTLLAYEASDGAPKWTLAFDEELASVLYTSVDALPAAAGADPWRSRAATSSTAVIVDVRGGIHVVDAATGVALGTLEAHTREKPVASAAAAGAFALAFGEEVVIFRDGARTSQRVRATALAFARDGATLAMGLKNEVRLASSARAWKVRGPVFDLVALPGGDWLAGTERGLVEIDCDEDETPAPVGAMPIEMLAVDRGNARVAVVRSATGAAILTRKNPSVTHRLFADSGREIVDVAFSDAGTLAVALEGGDVCFVNVATSAWTRTKPHPGRRQRAGALEVHDPDPPPTNTPVRAGAGLAGAGVAAMLAARALFSSSPAIPPRPIVTPIVQACDLSCETRRLANLRDACVQLRDQDCITSAEYAQQAYAEGRCSDAMTDLGRIRMMMLTQHDGGVGPSVVLASRLLAESGLQPSCASVAAAREPP